MSSGEGKNPVHVPSYMCKFFLRIFSKLPYMLIELFWKLLNYFSTLLLNLICNPLHPFSQSIASENIAHALTSSKSIFQEAAPIFQ